ncbi:MAG TPA: hypothetical protein VJ743_03525 [Albitalea sp.]|nr:hypothetical protein [Albitalea sp.]
MRTARWVIAAGLSIGACGAAWAVQGQGLVPSADSVWPRWQGRLSVGLTTPLFHGDTLASSDSGLKVGGASLLGDFYFMRSLRGVGSGTGFRATSGLLLGTRSAPLLSTPPSVGFSGRAFSVERRGLGGLSVAAGPNDPNADAGAVPYLGVGYTGLAGKGGWGFSADLGLMALNPGSVKLGRMLNGAQSLDDVLRDMRLSPLVQVGVSYSF